MRQAKNANKNTANQKKGSQVSKQRLCIACSGKQFSSMGEELITCETCNLTVAAVIPNFNELNKLYEKEYFFGMEYSDYKADRGALEHNFQQRIKLLRPYINKRTRLVEVGCAYGYFLNLLKDDVGWHQGFDVSKEGVEYAKSELGVNATSQDFLEVKDIKKESLDLVCMWDVVEHLGEPDKHIKKASELLKKGGVLSLTTGDMSSFVARKRGVNWRMVHPPTHIYYFNPNNMQKLLAKYGLKVIKVRHKATYRNVGSVFNQLICNRKAQDRNATLLSFGYKLAKLTKMNKLNIPLNLYDVMEVTAAKK